MSHLCACVTRGSCPLGLSPITAALHGCDHVQGRDAWKKKKVKGSWCQVRGGGRGAHASLPDLSITTPQWGTLLERSAPLPGRSTLCLLFPSLISYLITGTALRFRASGAKPHKPGGLSHGKVIVSPFWKLTVQKQGVSGAGGF